MTAKRDLKKRIRDRQARTGETYTTARRHVLAARDDDDAADADDAEVTNPGTSTPLSDKPPPFDVDELIDITDAASALGFKCNVLVYERLAAAVDPHDALVALRNALVAMTSDPRTSMLRSVMGGKPAKIGIGRATLRDLEFRKRVAAGLTAVSEDGRLIAIHVNGKAGMTTVVCAAWRRTPTLVLTTHDDKSGPVLAGLGAYALGVQTSLNAPLYLVFAGRRYPIGYEMFVIGRHVSCDLQIRDGYISRKHAAIVHRNGAFYILDLDSHSGVEYRGLKIKNKRIEEGDMYMLREYALRFTFHETDA